MDFEGLLLVKVTFMKYEKTLFANQHPTNNFAK